jgi:hypothetical protein
MSLAKTRIMVVAVINSDEIHIIFNAILIGNSEINCFRQKKHLQHYTTAQVAV